MNNAFERYDFLRDQAGYRRFCRLLILAALAVVCLATFSAWLANEGATRLNVFASIAGLSVVVMGEILIRRSPYLAMRAMATGMLCIILSLAALSGGLRATHLIALPLTLVVGGMMLTTGWLWGATIMTGVVLSVLAIVQGGPILVTLAALPVSTFLIVQIGSLVVLAVIITILRYSHQKNAERLETMTDAVANHAIRIELREKELARIIDFFPGYLAVIGPDQQVQFCNPACAALYGKSVAGMVGLKLSEFLTDTHYQQVLPAWEKVLRGEAIEVEQTLTDARSGKEIVLASRWLPEMLGDRLLSVNIVSVDITSRVVAETQIREANETLERRVDERTQALSQALERLQLAQREIARGEANATLGTLVSSMTHELGSPLGNSMMVATALSAQARDFNQAIESGQLKRSTLSQLTETLLSGTATIERNLARANEILHSFKQGAADQASSQRRQFDLATTIADTLEMLSPTLKRQPQKVSVTVADGITLDSYPGPLGQVIINLINNAFLHGFEGRDSGELRIEARADGQGVKLTIADNGVGMTAETVAKLFEPFFSTKIGKGGTGLGMSIVEHLVCHQLGGEITVTSVLGEGTTFHLTLPLTAPMVASVAVPG